MFFCEAETKLHDKYFKYENGWINLEIVTTIFPNIEAIQYFACNKDMNYWMRLSNVFKFVLGFIRKNNNQQLRLQKIEVMINENLEVVMKQYIEQFGRDFNNCGWYLFVFGQYDHSQNDYQRMMGYFLDVDKDNERHQSVVKNYEMSMEKMKRLGLHLPDLQKGIIRKN
eukprot:UN10235